MVSSSSSLAVNSLLGQPISEKLTKNIHILWKAEVIPIVQGVQLQGSLDGTVVAPPK
uniref:Uncharacterized protein n=1 Tax=Arundo donax TaxID=35708 RepID=A0A0A9A7Y5_ARUDO